MFTNFHLHRRQASIIMAVCAYSHDFLKGVLVTRIRRAAALTAAILVMLSLAACGTAVGSYRVLATLEEQQFSIGYRSGDNVQRYVEAAIRELSADGTLHSIALKWFSDDESSFPSRPGALGEVGTPEPRTLLVGVDEDAFPMSYMDENGAWAGFDVEAVSAVCTRLGWTPQFIPIKAENAYVELSSGNVDVAWGGLVLSAEDGDYVVSEPYMSNSVVVVSRAGADVRSMRALSGATLAVDVEQKYMDAVLADEDLMERPEQIKRVTGGAQVLFSALNAGEVDAIVVYSVALRYYAR